MWGRGCPVSWAEAVPQCVPSDSPLRAVPITPWGGDHGLTVLGVPVDGPESTAQLHGKWAKAVDLACELLRRLLPLPDGQVCHCLLRFCLDACRVTRLMRACPVQTVWNEL